MLKAEASPHLSPLPTLESILIASKAISYGHENGPVPFHYSGYAADQFNCSDDTWGPHNMSSWSHCKAQDYWDNVNDGQEQFYHSDLPGLGGWRKALMKRLWTIIIWSLMA